MPGLSLTHIGGPTVLNEFAGWRLLTDPRFDPPGGRYRFGWGTGSRKLGDRARLIAFAVSLPGRSALLVETSIKEGSK